MKKTILLLGLSAGLLFGKAYTVDDRIRDMQTMAQAMQDIQNGFFYNNYEMIEKGSLILANTIEKIQPPISEQEEKDVMTVFMNDKVKFTNKVRRDIKRRIRMMLDRFKDGNPSQALSNYTNITNECMKCHRKLRHW